MMKRTAFNFTGKMLGACIIFYAGMVSWGHADVFINVVAVNGATVSKNFAIHFNLPGELTAEDVLDTSGLQLDYSVDDADYYVFGDVVLAPKESKTYRIRVKDKWMVTPSEVEDLKKQIQHGYETLGKVNDPVKAGILKDRLEKKIIYIVDLQSNNAESVEKRIDDYRMYIKELKRIQNAALDVNYWRSQPDEEQPLKLIHLNIEVTNPTKAMKHYKHKDFLPEEVKPEDVVEAGNFEVRYDQIKQSSFLFKEEDLAPGETKKYAIGILDKWFINSKSLDYLSSRTQNAYDFLKNSKFEESAKILTDRIMSNLKDIQQSQAVQREILEHISAYRTNRATFDETQRDVETLEKLLAVYREDLEKSKVENVLQKIRSLKAAADVSKVMFNKKFESSTAWGFLQWLLLFIGVLTLAAFVVALVRSKDKKIKDGP